MKFKRITAFLISTALMVGMMPALVLANEVSFAADETEAVETTEEAKEDSESKEKTKEPEEKKPEVNEDKASESKEEAPEVKEDKEPEAEEEQTSEAEKTPEKDKVQSSGAAIAPRAPEVKSKSSKSDENDKLFNDYVNKLLYPDRYATRKAASFAGSRLSGAEKSIYDALKPQIAKIANGTSSSTRIVITVNNTGIENKEFSKADLGITEFLEVINGQTYLTYEASLAVLDKMNLDIDAIHDALLFDCPSEMYWYDKTIGVIFFPYVKVSDDKNSGHYTGYMDVYFNVADAYKGSDNWTVNTGKIKTVKSAISNAKKVVENAKSKRDYDKLVYYRDYICSQVEYNHPAVEDPNTPYGNPWQLIWVFDKNSSTDVVCEGYSKAFKYLCDLSTFNNPNLSCLLVTGDMDGEGHMWNIMQFGNGKNYIVDVTNSDAGEKGLDYVFLAGYSSGSVEKGYTHSFDALTTSGVKHFDWNYVYDEDTLKAYSKEQLTLCNYNYSSSLDVHDTCGNLSWSVDHTGILRITGDGSIDNFTPDSPAPWMAYGSYIETVVLSGKITSIGEYAFSGLPILKYVVIPGSVTSIGSYAFYGCPNLSKISGGTNVRTIGTYAFAKCSKLSSFSIKSSKLKKIGSFVFSGDGKLKTIFIQKTTKLTKSGVKWSLKGSSVKTVKVKKSKVKKYKKFFKKSNSGRSVKVKK